MKNHIPQNVYSCIPQTNESFCFLSELFLQQQNSSWNWSSESKHKKKSGKVLWRGNVEREIWQAQRPRCLNNSWPVCSATGPTRAWRALTGEQKKQRGERRSSSETSLHFASSVCVCEGDGREMSVAVRKFQSDPSPAGFKIQFQQVTKYRCPLWLVIRNINPMGRLRRGARSLQIEKSAHRFWDRQSNGEHNMTVKVWTE